MPVVPLTKKSGKRDGIFTKDILDDDIKVCYNSKLREKFFSNFAMPWAAPRQEGKRVSQGLSAKEKVVGLKQTRRALEEGRAVKVYLACDAEKRLTDPLLETCRRAGVPTETGYSLRQLGRACGIQVGTAAAALLAK